MRSSLPRLLGVVLLLSAGLAHAQFAWIDAKGIKHYSDRPPPPDTPPAKILKAPGKHAALMDLIGPGDAKPDDAAAASAKAAAPTLADREADFRKRAQEKAKEERKAAAEAQLDRAQQANCAQAQRYKNALESGMRMTETANDGGQQWMSDAERARRLADSNEVLANCR